jgi:RES domain-containing protein
MPESGAGAATSGGRFNPVGVPALYTSLRFQTAWLEAQQGFPYKAQPMLLCAYDVDCKDVLDLTQPGVRKRHKISEAELACPWKDLQTRKQPVPSWRMMERLTAEEIAGILVPSFATGARPDDVNAVFWSRGDVPTHQVRVIDDAGPLPRDARSWR